MVTPLRVTCSRPPLNSDPLLIVTVCPSAMRSVADSLPSMPWTETTARRLDGAEAAEPGVDELLGAAGGGVRLGNTNSCLEGWLRSCRRFSSSRMRTSCFSSCSWPRLRVSSPSVLGEFKSWAMGAKPVSPFGVCVGSLGGFTCACGICFGVVLDGITGAGDEDNVCHATAPSTIIEAKPRPPQTRRRFFLMSCINFPLDCPFPIKLYGFNTQPWDCGQKFKQPYFLSSPVIHQNIG